MNEQQFEQLQVDVHDARRPLNRITMQAELIKMALNGDVTLEKAMIALDKIITECKSCSESLSQIVARNRPDSQDNPE
ncbi:hypothetical protein FJ444_04220 [Aestuariibacter sp. GS-14]|uniref:hypothetical protein n=1 Tax=Aestuariibacter sp. GS-14 TaxID=2590670 RepID=UPI0011272796|nr:hypothetical protein [Aestuariibacter sp. GS-14]TPV60836.1 hypothetical protein FJ444_04220 [Aestuariibacter sp. GS-14]